MRRGPTLVAMFGVAAVMAGGCGGGGPKLARVTGMVTLDGKPYTRGLISFQPVGGKENPNPGKGSVGQTDDQGRFELVYDGTTRGAVVGLHLVRISTLPGKGVDTDPNSIGSPDGEVVPKARDLDFDPIPMEWNENSKKTFEVPPGGTDKAIFDIVSPPKKSGKAGKK